MIELRIVRKRYARPFVESDVYLSINMKEMHDEASYVKDVLQYRDRVYHHNPLGAGHVSGEKWQDVPVVEEE